MEKELLDELQAQSSGKRSKLLVVLCIMTWLGCLYILMSYAYLFKMIAEVWNFGVFGNLIDPWIFWKAVIGTLSALLSLFGSFVLFSKRKWGFYFYVPGQLIPLLVAAYPPFMFDLQRPVSAEYILVTIIVSFAFIFLYRKSMKQLKPAAID